MNKLILLRHGQSQWNLENKFTGWEDVPLTNQGIVEAKKAGVILKKNNIEIDAVFSSVLKRANKTAEIALNDPHFLHLWNDKKLDMIKDQSLNETLVLDTLAESDNATVKENYIPPKSKNIYHLL